MKRHNSQKVKMVETELDRTKFTMFDLLSYNPPLSESHRKSRDSELESTSKEVTEQTISTIEEPSVRSDDDNDEPSDSGVCPRVKVGLNGEIILDEESIVVKRKTINSDNSKVTIIEEGKNQSGATYSSFRKRPCTLGRQRWTEQETTKFYTALSLIGTDFTMMSELFFKGQRSRFDLKNKFKREERIHKSLVDKVFSGSDLSFLPDSEDLDKFLENGSSSEDDGEFVGPQNETKESNELDADDTQDVAESPATESENSEEPYRPHRTDGPSEGHSNKKLKGDSVALRRSSRKCKANIKYQNDDSNCKV